MASVPVEHGVETATKPSIGLSNGGLATLKNTNRPDTKAISISSFNDPQLTEEDMEQWTWSIAASVKHVDQLGILPDPYNIMLYWANRQIVLETDISAEEFTGVLKALHAHDPRLQDVTISQGRWCEATTLQLTITPTCWSVVCDCLCCILMDGCGCSRLCDMLHH